MNTAAAGTVQVVPEICPYCGGGSMSGARCQLCRGLIDPLSLQASQNEMGPWFVHSTKAPFLPGCSYRLVVQHVAKGRITIDSILRGPTTRQFWMKASRTPGIANLLGMCHSCAASVPLDCENCQVCHASFVVDSSRQALGLGPVYLVPGQSIAHEVVVAGKKLPPLVGDSVDLEPLFLEQDFDARPLPNTEKASIVSLAPTDPQPQPASGAKLTLLLWALAATIFAGVIAADSWLNLNWGIAGPISHR